MEIFGYKGSRCSRVPLNFHPKGYRLRLQKKRNIKVIENATSRPIGWRTLYLNIYIKKLHIKSISLSELD